MLVGIPGQNAARKPEEGEKTAASNAVIGYVQEYGDDQKNIPARPFLIPGVAAAKHDIADALARGANAVLSGKTDQVAKALSKAGQIAEKSVKAKLSGGPFAPLSERTIEERARRGRSGAKKYLRLKGQGVPTDVLSNAGVGLVTPLIDTGQLRNSITHVIRKRGEK